MYEVLVNHPDVVYSVSVVSHTEIDDVNILQGIKISYSLIIFREPLMRLLIFIYTC